MDRKTFDVEIITPEGSQRHARARSVKLPGVDGGFGILAGHAPMIAALDIGICEAEWEDGSTERFAVGDGFVEVDKTAVRILTDFADDEAHIDVERAQRAEARAREHLGHRSDPDTDDVRASVALRRAVMRLRIARRMGTLS